MNNRADKTGLVTAQLSTRFYAVIQQSEEDWEAKKARVLCVTVRHRKAREVSNSAPNTCTLLMRKPGLYAKDSHISFGLLAELLREIAIDLGLDAVEGVLELLRELYIAAMAEERRLWAK